MIWFIVAALAQDLTVTGTCPGPVSLRLSDLVADGRWALISSSGPGSAELPGGVCVGAVSGLAEEGLALRRFGESRGGVREVDVELGALACELHLQLVDLATCGLGPVVTLEASPDLDGTFVVGEVDRIVRLEGIDGTGPLEVQCRAWDADVCTMLEVRTPLDGCEVYGAVDLFHEVVAANRPDERACPLLCAATTGGRDERATVCRAGPGSVGGDQRACSWADPDPICAVDDWYWRTDVSTMGEPWVVNLRLGDCYPGSAPLQLSCAGWIE